MAIMTIEGKEYEIDTMTDEQKELVNVIRINTTTANVTAHQLQCVNAIGRVKVDELKSLIESNMNGKNN